MFPLSCDRQDVYLFCDPVDMRKSINGLSALVDTCLDINPVSDNLFVFINRMRDKIKILQWSGNGFWLHYKVLEKDHFRRPLGEIDGEYIRLSRQQLNWLLDGLPIEQKAHQSLTTLYGII